MKTDIDKYRTTSKTFVWTNLKLDFQNIYETADRKILELKEVVGFIENVEPEKPIKTLRLDKGGGSYNLDLSLRLQRPRD